MSTHPLPTVRIKADHPDLPGYLVINESDFDPEIHKKWVPPTRVPRVAKKSSGAVTTEAAGAEDGAD